MLEKMSYTQFVIKVRFFNSQYYPHSLAFESIYHVLLVEKSGTFITYSVIYYVSTSGEINIVR
jgi:hypothetical protein